MCDVLTRNLILRPTGPCTQQAHQDQCCESNWARVVASRVKTMAGLIISERLSEDLPRCTTPQLLVEVLESFQAREASCIEDDVCDAILRSTEPQNGTEPQNKHHTETLPCAPIAVPPISDSEPS